MLKLDIQLCASNLVTLLTRSLEGFGFGSSGTLDFVGEIHLSCRNYVEA